MTLAPPPLVRLVRVELRKAVDTRAGRWLAGGWRVLRRPAAARAGWLA